MTPGWGNSTSPALSAAHPTPDAIRQRLQFIAIFVANIESFVRQHSLHVPTIELLNDTVESVEFLVAIGRDSIKEDHSAVYAGMLGTTGQSEIDQDVQRLKAAGLITEKAAQYVTYVECDGSHRLKPWSPLSTS